jgi:hypothetical protein
MIPAMAHDAVATPGAAELLLSICTLVRSEQLYCEMLEAFQRQGFAQPDCEFLYVDNRIANQFDGYGGYNHFLARARGRYVILCHEDVRPLEHRDALLQRIAELDAKDPNWAVLGNAGGAAIGQLAVMITDPLGENRRIGGPLPQRVSSLDENFVLAKAQARLSCSRALKGFHHYATDLCLNAETLGFTCYVVDYHLNHLGGASVAKDKALYTVVAASAQALMREHGRRRRAGRFLQTPIGRMYLSGNAFMHWLGNRKCVLMLAKRWYGLTKRA